MKRFFLVTAMAAGLLIVCCGPYERRSLTIMSFNIRYDNPSDGENNWTTRRERVAGTIRFHKVDAAGLQEALAHQVDWLDSALSDYGWVGCGRDDGKRTGEFAPIFYRRDRLTLLADSVFWLSPTPTVAGSRGWDAACVRVATWARFRDRSNGVEFTLINTHLDHMGQEARRQSALLILKKISTRFGRGPLLLTGDFNSIRQDEAYQIIHGGSGGLSGLAEARDLSSEPAYGSSFSFNGFKNGVSPGDQIDFIFLKGFSRVGRHGVLSEVWDGRFASDHFPVLADCCY